MLGGLFGAIFLGLSVFLAVGLAREVSAGEVSMAWPLSWPKFRETRSEGAFAFWLLICAKLLAVSAIGYVGLRMVLAA